MLDVVHWCSFCSSRPSDGDLTIVDELGEIVTLPACYYCVQEIQQNQEEHIEGL